MTTMTDKMAKASATPLPKTDPGVGSPKKGERFRCQKCGMELQITADCRHQGSDPAHFHCCGEKLEKM